jgi:preprotein translocase subunit SecG
MDWPKLKPFLVLMLTRWLLKAVGGILVGVGLQGGEAADFLTQVSTMVVGGAFFLIGIGISWLQNKYLAKMEPGKLMADNILSRN